MKKILMVALCLVLVPMLFAAKSDADVVHETAGLTLSGPRSLLVDRKPIDFVYNRSDLLFDQHATHQGSFCACQNDSVMGFYPRIADNFTVTSDADVDSLVWWGGYWGTMTNPIMDFLIEIYPDSGGGLGPMQASIYSARVGFTETDLGGWYIYDAVIPPFAATAGVTYWIVFQPFLTYPPQWGNNCDVPPAWGDGQEMYFKSPYFGFPDWVTATTVFGVPNESSFQIYGTTGGAATFWDFEDGWQGWTHTSGLTFPAAWDVQPSGYQSSYTPPDAGDSTMWIDSDAAGSGGPWIQDTALSPALVPNFGWLKWGVGYRHLGSGFMDVGIKYFDGATWTAVPLVTYNATFGPAWDSVDVSTYNGYDSIQVYFYYDDDDSWLWYAGFDNVGLSAAAAHDVGCSQVVSPPAGTVSAADYDVIGRIQNYGSAMETFDVTANVYDTVGMVQVFTQTVTLTDFPVAGDSNVNFGTVTFAPDSYYYTEIFTLLAGDVNPSNDTCLIYSTTAMTLGDIIFELDVEGPTGSNLLLGVEFDGTYFYVTGAGSPNNIYVIDTAGNVIWTIAQNTTTSWGMRDLAWDGVYTGTDRIDTLYASDDNATYQFGIDLATGTMDVYTPFSGPSGVLPCRALGWDDADEWFFTANWDPLYKFQKDGTVVQGPVTGPGSVYGCAYDNWDATIWWHGQTGPHSCHLTQMYPSDMTMTGVTLDINANITSGMAGGLCYHHSFRGMDVLFALIQGTPDAIVGIYLRGDGIEENSSTTTPVSFGFAPMTNPTKGSAISYITTTQGNVSLKVYDGTGRLVETLVNSVQPVGLNTVNWDTRNLANGVYFFKLDAENQHATHKLILIK